MHLAECMPDLAEDSLCVRKQVGACLMERKFKMGHS